MPGRTAASVAPASTAMSTSWSSSGNGPVLGRLVGEQQVVEGLGDLRPGASSTTAKALAASRSSRSMPLEELERAVLDLTSPASTAASSSSPHVCLQLAAERAQEVLVDDDLVGRVGVADDQAECRSRRRRGVAACRSRRLAHRGRSRRRPARGRRRRADAVSCLALRPCGAPRPASRRSVGPRRPLAARRLPSAVLCEVFFGHRGFLLVGRRSQDRWSSGGQASPAPGATTGVRRARASASRPTSRAISPGYFAAASAI